MTPAPRRLLIVTPEYYPRVGGYALAATNFVRALVEEGSFQVHLVTPQQLGAAAEIEHPRLTVERLPLSSGLRYQELVDQFLWSRILKRRIRTQRWDAVLFETLELPLMLYLVVRGEKSSTRKFLVRIHGTNAMEGFRFSGRLLHRLYWRLVGAVIRRVPTVLSTTPRYFDFLREENVLSDEQFRKKRMQVVGNVTNVVVDQPPVLGGETVLLSLGRMDDAGYYQKNFELLAYGLAELKASSPDAYRRIRLKVIGNGSKQADLRRLINDLGVAERVEIEDSVPHDELRRMQAQAAAVVLLSRFEGLSMFALEALAVGAPLIFSRGTGISDLVVEHVNGYLVDPGSAREFADAIKALLCQDLAEMRTASRKLFDERFSTRHVLAAFEAALPARIR